MQIHISFQRLLTIPHFKTIPINFHMLRIQLFSQLLHLSDFGMPLPPILCIVYLFGAEGDFFLGGFQLGVEFVDVGLLCRGGLDEDFEEEELFDHLFRPESSLLLLKTIALWFILIPLHRPRKSILSRC